MKFQTLKKSHKKEIIIGIVAIILIAVVLLVKNSFAKYQTTKNLKIAEGTINYTVPDFKIMGIYYQKEGQTCTEDNCYEEKESMPESGYTINTTKSYCELNGNKNNNAEMYTDENGQHVISKLAKGDRCYLYFDKVVKASDTILAGITVKDGTPDFSKTATTDEGVFKASDDDGTSYYFRGAVENNYVKFANKYWRIIRINGDGSIRMIYDGKNVRANGNAFNAETSAFNPSSNNNMYVGFKYTSGEAQGTGTKSTILAKLESWYTTNLASYVGKLETNAGFCGDRRRNMLENAEPNGTGGTGTTMTYYAAVYRLRTNKKPELSCENADLYTVKDTAKGNKALDYPIGLITADEVALAGGVYGKENNGYYLYTKQYYWTMTPAVYHNASCPVHNYGIVYNGSLDVPTVENPNGVRPVINLRADTKFTYKSETTKGTMDDPYVVE